MNFRKVNNITGWVILLIAIATYALTREATASFWDCGEFIACANEIGIPHPPGSPLFTMLGRLFIVLFSGGNAANAASAVNLLSATASGFTILFLFWTITHFARKMFVKHGEELSDQQLVTVMASGVVGALAYTFSDTFWFSAVEGEVYALSSFFTALIIWSMLKWEHAYELAKDNIERNRADRWIVFLFFMLGLSITVHLLNLLTVPAVVMIYFYKKYTPTVKKSIIAFLFSCLLTGVMLWGMVYFIPKTSAGFDRIFVNNFDLPIDSGLAFFFILLGVICWVLLRVAKNYAKPLLRLGVWCFLFMLLGYSTYVTTLIRSKANPGIDMSNVDNPVSLASYFGREQYGSAPILYGPHFGAYPADEDGNGSVVKEKGIKWGRLGNKYINIGKDFDYEFPKDEMMFFPRIWDWQDQQDHLRFYADWLNKTPVGRDPQTNRLVYDPPIKYSDNISWFFSYQMSFMYWRYFMWNFSGRQNDLQGFGNKRDGNWQTGISFIDKQMLGDQSKLPESLKNNKANNKLYLLPFLLGILGCVYQFIKKRDEWVISFLLFFFTGIAIGLYLNMPGNQPRERDYAFVGSFYAYAIWIGLSVLAFVRLVKESKQNFTNTIIFGSVLTFVVTAFSLMNFSFKAVFLTSLMVAALYALLSGGLTSLFKAISSNGSKEKILNIAVAAFCMITPLLMANQEWDDHDRSKKTWARDNAINYLESCAPNAILFCYGDNDTYPLWYAQEVERIRPDIRIINTSLLGIDWYINQLRYKINKSDSIDVIWSPDQIIGDRRAQLQYYPAPNIPKDVAFDLYDVMKNVVGKGENAVALPVKKFKVPVDSAVVRENGTVNSGDVVPSEMVFELPDNEANPQRDKLIILNIIATTQWKRPIYFTTSLVGMGLQNHLRKEGLTYRLTPVVSNGDVNTDVMEENIMKKFRNGSADKNGVYYDEENRRHLYTVRQSFGELASSLISNGRNEEAKQVLLKADTMFPDKNVPYGIPSRYEFNNAYSAAMMDAAYTCGATELAEKIYKRVDTDFNEQLEYYASLGDMTKNQLTDILNNYRQKRMMDQIQQKNTGEAESYLTANLSQSQLGLVIEMTRAFDLLQSAKVTKERYNPTAPAANPSQPAPDTNQLKLPDTSSGK